MHIAVTGASGFIGRALLERLRQRGDRVRAVSRGPDLASYADTAALARALGDADAIIHLAARAHRQGDDAAFTGNVEATRALMQVAHGRRVVLVSSIGVNGNRTTSRPFSEVDHPQPVEPYARSKLRSEEIVRVSTNFVIVRPPLVYGPRAPGNFARLVWAVSSGWPLPLGAIRNKRSLIGLDNLCELLMCCASHPSAAGELFLASDGEDLSTPEIVEALAEGLCVRPRLWRCPPSILRLGGERFASSLCASLQVDSSKARRVLGWTPKRPAREGIVAAAAAWRSP